MNKMNWSVAFILAVLISASPCNGQEWAMTYDWGYSPDIAYSTQQTTDGGYVVAGRSAVRFGGDDLLVLKLDVGGGVTWQKTYGAGHGEIANSIQQTTDGGYIVAGFAESEVWGPSDDAWVLKLDSSGNVAWQKTYGSSYDDTAESIQQTADGGYILGIHLDNILDDYPTHPMWVVKINPDGHPDGNGSIAWQKAYAGPFCYTPHLGPVQQTADGGYIHTAYHCSLSCVVLKLYPDGQPNPGDFGVIQWQKSIEHWPSSDCPRCIGTTDGGFLIAGSGGVSAGACVVKLDSYGDIVWQKEYLPTDGTDFNEEVLDVRQTMDGGYVLAGGDGGDAWILKLDSNGAVEWERIYGGKLGNNKYKYPLRDRATSIYQTQDGGYVVSGYTESFSRHAEQHVLVLRLDANGDCSFPCNYAVRTTRGLSAFDSTLTANDITAFSSETTTATPYDLAYYVQDASVSMYQVCPSMPGVSELYPNHGGYGLPVKIKGWGIGPRRKGMVNADDGFYSVVTLEGDINGEPRTMIRPRYQRWVFDNVRLKIKNLFMDANGNYIQDQDEPLMGMWDQLPLGDYVVRVNTVWFHDLNNSGIYDEGDEIFDSYASAPQVFTLTDEPVIYRVNPDRVSKYYGTPWKVGNVIIKGVNFGNTQGSRTLHVGGRVWSAGDPNILVWRDNKIQFKFPRGADSDYLGIKVREGSSTSNRVVIETLIYYEYD